MAFYGSIAEADTYFAERGDTVWAAAGAGDKTFALVRASQYLDAVYTWPGQVADVAQELEWPRTSVSYRGVGIDAATVPLPIQRAAYEAAVRELNAPGYLNPDFELSGQIKSKSEAIGPLSESVEYAVPTGAISARPKILMIDGMLRGLVRSGAGAANFAVTRA